MCFVNLLTSVNFPYPKFVASHTLEYCMLEFNVDILHLMHEISINMLYCMSQNMFHKSLSSLLMLVHKLQFILSFQNLLILSIHSLLSSFIWNISRLFFQCSALTSINFSLKDVNMFLL